MIVMSWDVNRYQYPRDGEERRKTLLIFLPLRVIFSIIEFSFRSGNLGRPHDFAFEARDSAFKIFVLNSLPSAELSILVSQSCTQKNS